MPKQGKQVNLGKSYCTQDKASTLRKCMYAVHAKELYRKCTITKAIVVGGKQNIFFGK